jgi:hypothetical protein
LQQGKWSWLSLARAFARVVIQQVGGEIIYLAIDDTLVLRSSKKAPASQIHHQHGNKPNLAGFVRGQCWEKNKYQATHPLTPVKSRLPNKY